MLHAGVVSGPRECGPVGFAELPDHTACLILHGPLCCGGLRASVSCTSRLGEETSVVGVALVPAIGVLLRCSGLRSLPLLLHPKSLPSLQTALGTLGMEVSEDTCLVWGSIPRAWHNVRPEATLVNEETGPVALPRLFWMALAHSPYRTSTSLFLRRVIFPWEKVQTSADGPRVCMRPCRGPGAGWRSP